MAETLDKLLEQLNGYQPYTPLSDEEIRTQAADRYRNAYAQKRLNARQAYETEDAALARELSGLQKHYDEQRVSSAARIQSAYSQADRHALSRGMQRSSFNEATLANIDLAGNQEQRDIDRQEAAHNAEIGEKRTQLGRQLSETLDQLDENQRSDELAYADELSAREYDRSVSSQNAYRDLAAQLYEYQRELEREAAEQARWQAEFDAKYGDSSAGAAGSRRSTLPAAKQTGASVKTSGVRPNQKEQMV